MNSSNVTTTSHSEEMVSGDIEVLSKINTISQIKELLLPTVKIRDLDSNQTIKINKVKNIKTKYRNCIILESDGFQFFLPPRFCKMDDDVIQKLISMNNLYIKTWSNENNFNLSYFHCNCKVHF